MYLILSAFWHYHMQNKKAALQLREPRLIFRNWQWFGPDVIITGRAALRFIGDCCFGTWDPDSWTFTWYWNSKWTKVKLDCTQRLQTSTKTKISTKIYPWFASEHPD